MERVRAVLIVLTGVRKNTSFEAARGVMADTPHHSGWRGCCGVRCRTFGWKRRYKRIGGEERTVKGSCSDLPTVRSTLQMAHPLCATARHEHLRRLGSVLQSTPMPLRR